MLSSRLPNRRNLFKCNTINLKNVNAKKVSHGHRLEDDQVGSDYLLFFISKGYPSFFKSIVQLLVHKLVTACSGVQKIDLVSCEPWIVSFLLQSGLLNFKCSYEKVRAGNQFTAYTLLLKHLRKWMGFFSQIYNHFTDIVAN